MAKISTLTFQKSKQQVIKKEKNTVFRKVYEDCILCNENILIIFCQKNNNQFFIFNSDLTMFSLLDMILLFLSVCHYVINTVKSNHHSVITLKNFEQSSNFNDSITCKFFSCKRILNIESQVFDLV